MKKIGLESHFSHIKTSNTGREKWNGGNFIHRFDNVKNLVKYVLKNFKVANGTEVD